MDDDLELGRAALARAAGSLAASAPQGAAPRDPAGGWPDVRRRAAEVQRRHRRRAVLVAAAALVIVAGGAASWAWAGARRPESVRTTDGSGSASSAPPSTSVGTSPPATRQGALQAVQMVSTTTGFAVGDHGTILATHDGGGHWSSGATCGGGAFCGTADLTEVDAVDATHAWAAGPSVDLRTTDGRHWFEYGTQPVLGVHFIDASKGWAASATGSPVGPDRLVHTTDGGTTWTVVPTPTAVAATCFSSGSVGWYANASQVLGTTDGGRTWRSAYRLPGSIPPAAGGGLDRPLGLECAAPGVVYAEIQEGVPATGGQVPLVFLRATTAANSTQALLYGGQPLLQPHVHPIVDSSGPFSVIDATTAFFVGNAPALGAATGVPIEGATPGAPHQIHGPAGTQLLLHGASFADRERGWAVGQASGRPILLATTDGGLTWHAQPIP